LRARAEFLPDVTEISGNIHVSSIMQQKARLKLRRKGYLVIYVTKPAMPELPDIVPH